MFTTTSGISFGETGKLHTIDLKIYICHLKERAYSKYKSHLLDHAGAICLCLTLYSFFCSAVRVAILFGFE